MTSPVTRAVLVALVGSLSLLAPIIHWGTAVLFGVIAVVAIAIPRDSRLFDWLAHPLDRDAGQLRGIGGFSLAATALAILGTVEAFELSAAIFVLTLLIVGVGHLGETVTRRFVNTPAVGAGAFVTVGATSAIAGWWVIERLGMENELALGVAVFFATLGALIGALCRSDFYRRDDPVVLLTVGLLLWVVAFVTSDVHVELVLVALAVTGALGALAYVLETASVAGMLSGIIVGYVTVVLAGFVWFALLLAFFAIGGFATKYRYEVKLEKGVAEQRRGARGTGNVLGNSLVAVGAVLAYVVAPTVPWMTESIAALAFGSAVATALADTLSSEIGSLRDEPILITTREPVQAGTDGAITMIGSLAGGVGAAIIAFMAYILIPEVEVLAALIVFIAGIGGMFADSLLGATLEGSWIDNQGVNLLATAVGAVFGVIGAIALALL